MADATVDISDESTNYAALAGALQTVSNNVTASMQSFAAAQSARAARLTAVQTRLQANSSTPSATILDLSTKISSATTIAQSIGALAGRIAARPTIDPTDAVVFGQLVDSTGTGVSGSYVRLTNSSGELKIGSSVMTADSGDFSLRFAPCELPDSEKALVVAVEDSSGTRQVVSSTISPKAGSPVYVNIALATSKSVAPKQPKPKLSPRSPATGTRGARQKNS